MFNKVKDVDRFDFHLEAIFPTRSRMLTKATFTSKPFFNKVKDVDNATVTLNPCVNNVKDVDKCHFLF